MTAGGSSQARVMAALERRGVSAAAARAAWALGGSLRLRTRLLRLAGIRREFAGMAGAQTGAQVGPIIRGQGDRIDIGRQLATMHTMQSEQRYVSIHTHPGSSAFSADDAALLVVHPTIRVAVVVGADGTWYLLDLPPGQPALDEAALRSAYRAALEALVPKYLDLVQSRRLTRAAAWLAHSHEIWEQAALAHGLRYDRIGKG
jgi:hypothetical protein